MLFGFLNQEFSFINDYISMLGATGQPVAIWWNITGFILVGLFLIGFGMSYGKFLNDRLVGILFSLFGLGFGLTLIPIDIDDSDSPVSKTHVVAICLALAFWLFGLARITYNHSLKKAIRLRTNIAATLLTLSMIGFALGLWSMPTTHRLVFGVVFGWTAITSAL